MRKSVLEQSHVHRESMPDPTNQAFTEQEDCEVHGKGSKSFLLLFYITRGEAGQTAPPRSNLCCYFLKRRTLPVRQPRTIFQVYLSEVSIIWKISMPSHLYKDILPKMEESRQVRSCARCNKKVDRMDKSEKKPCKPTFPYRGLTLQP